jgi:hypothetical protein
MIHSAAADQDDVDGQHHDVLAAWLTLLALANAIVLMGLDTGDAHTAGIAHHTTAEG